MKNIHVLPTENSSRLSYNKDGVLELHRLQWRKNTQNIYITSDEEIKEGDWTLKFPFGDEIFKNVEVGLNDYVKKEGLHTYPYNWCEKIILTTDQELIKDGVWGIEDGFLEWFVKNPTCEYVELKGYAIILPGESCDCDNICNTCKEKEPKLQCKDCNDNLTDCTCIEDIVDMKQETLEEAAQRVFDGFADITKPSAVRRALELVKWQQEQDKNKYSEEDMKSSFQVGFNVGYNDEESPSYLTFEEWIKEYKKK